LILVDANLLVYAANTAAPEHGQSRAWLDARLNATAPVGFPWPSLLAFVRLVSNPAVLSKPVSTARAWGQVNEWLSCDAAWIPAPSDAHAALVGRFLQLEWMTSRLVPDAHLAALAIEHGVVCCSTDADFTRFPGLKWENPLAAR